MANTGSMSDANIERDRTKPECSDGVTADMTVQAIVTSYPRTARVFLQRMMNCAGCCLSSFHDLATAAETFNVDLQALLDELNREAGCADTVDR